MKIDFLTDSDWRDSYESRFIEDNKSAETPEDIIELVRKFLQRRPDYPFFPIYIYANGSSWGEFNKRIVKQYPEVQVEELDKGYKVTYPHGNCITYWIL